MQINTAPITEIVERYDMFVIALSVRGMVASAEITNPATVNQMVHAECSVKTLSMIEKLRM